MRSLVQIAMNLYSVAIEFAQARSVELSIDTVSASEAGCETVGFSCLDVGLGITPDNIPRFSKNSFRPTARSTANRTVSRPT
jgi:hypothetical protein